jgi:hypothetical protein
MTVPFTDIEIQDLADFAERHQTCFCCILIVDDMTVAYRLEVHHCAGFTRKVFPVAKMIFVPIETMKDAKCN